MVSNESHYNEQPNKCGAAHRGYTKVSDALRNAGLQQPHIYLGMQRYIFKNRHGHILLSCVTASECVAARLLLTLNISKEIVLNPRNKYIKLFTHVFVLTYLYVSFYLHSG